MRITKIIFFFLLLVLCAFSQEVIPSHSELKLGGAFPIGEFAEEDNGAALIGFGGGLSFYTPINYFFGLEAELVGSYNSIDTERLESAFTNVDAGSWLNTFGLVGIRIDTKITGSSSIFLTGKGGAVYSMSPSLEYSNNTNTAKMESGNAFGFAFQFGAGIMVDRIVIGASYLNGGELEYEYDVKYSMATHQQKMKQKIGIVMLYLGVLI